IRKLAVAARRNHPDRDRCSADRFGSAKHLADAQAHVRKRDTHSEHATIGSSSPSFECSHRRPSDSINSIAPFGPQVPGTYSSGSFFDSAKLFTIPSITAHAASASSP